MMEIKDPIIENYGILTSISWNSNKWAGEPTKEDLDASGYGFVQDKAHMHESLNFGHNIYPAEDDGYYIGYSPMLNRQPDPIKSKFVDIIFFVSTDYKNAKRKAVIGFYGFPIFGGIYYRQSNHPIFESYDGGNLKAYPENIIFFDHPVIISNETVQSQKLLPLEKLISQHGFNYLNSDNVQNLLSLALQLNPDNTKLVQFVRKFPIQIEAARESHILVDFYDAIEDITADSLNGIAKLELKMRKLTPKIRERISNYIERGAIADRVKKLTGFKCLICEALNNSPYGFKKPNGEYYIETHHVDPVSTLKKGALSINNLITVCANHHRQLHYGNSEVLEQTPSNFQFKIDGKIVSIRTIRID